MSVINVLSVYFLCMVLTLNFLSRFNLNAKIVSLLVIIGALWIPINGTTTASFLASFFGELSVTSLILLGSALVFRLSKIQWVSRYDFKFIMAFIGMVGALFYFSALTPSVFDYYEAGYGYTPASWVVWGMVLIVGIVALSLECYSLLLIFFISCLAYSFSCYQSNNFWDYLIDAPLFIYSIYFWIKTAIKSMMRRSQISGNLSDPEG